MGTNETHAGAATPNGPKTNHYPPTSLATYIAELQALASEMSTTGDLRVRRDGLALLALARQEISLAADGNTDPAQSTAA